MNCLIEAGGAAIFEFVTVHFYSGDTSNTEVKKS